MLSFLLATALAFSEANARTAFASACNLVASCTPRDAGTARGHFAANHLRNAALLQGANARIETFTAPTPVGMREFHNVVAEWEVCPTGKWVVVVSHYDTKPFVKCPGANDGASTCGILIGMAQAASKCRNLPGNLMLMWLDGEECMFAYGPSDGLWGSKEAAMRLKTSGRDIKSVICLDMLGDANLKISLPRNTNAELRRLAIDCARRTGHEGLVTEMRESVKDDHLPFRSLGFSAVDLIDFDYGSAPGLNDYWHTSRDTIDKISTSSLLIAGEIACEMVNALWR